MLGPEFSEIASSIPADHARRMSAPDMLNEIAKSHGPGPCRILDFGCGSGDGIDSVKSTFANAQYTGIDIEHSPEVATRSRQDGAFHTYDGTTLPFPDHSFDIVYSRQVLEHVRHPDRVVAELHRVLRPGGKFVGSLSNLEPYHSFSIFNYTPYGLYRLLTDNGFALRAMRPGPEGVSLIVRQLTMRRISGFELAYPAFGLMASLRGWDARRLNYLRLRFSGHIAFIAERPSDPAENAP